MRKSMVFLWLICISLCVVACHAEKPMESENPAQNGIVTSPKPTTTVPFTRTILYTPTDNTEQLIGVQAAGETLYLLTSTHIRVFAGEEQTAFPIDLAKPAALTVTENAVLVLGEDAALETLLLEYDLAGQLLRTYDAFGSVMNAAREGGMVRAADTLYFAATIYSNVLGTDMDALCTYDTASGVLTKTETPACDITPGPNGTLLLTEPSRRIVAYDPATGETAEAAGFAGQKPWKAAYHASSDAWYFVNAGYNDANANVPVYLRRLEADGGARLLAPITLSPPRVNRMATHISIAFFGASMALVDYNRLTVYDHIAGDWAEVKPPLRVAAPSAESYSLLREEFADIEGQIIPWLYDTTGAVYQPAQIEMISIDRESTGAPALLDKEYDLLLLDHTVSGRVTADDTLADLSVYPGLQSCLDTMLPGVAALCRADDKTIGIPLGATVRFADMPETVQADLYAATGSRWTYADFLAYQQTFPDSPPLFSRDEIAFAGFTMALNAAAGHIPEADELSAFLNTARALDGAPASLIRNSFYANFLTYASAHNHALTMPLYAENAKTPVDIALLAVNPASDRMDDIIPFLKAYIDKDFLYNAIGGEDFALLGAKPLIWYPYDVLWEKHAFLVDYAEILTNSVRRERDILNVPDNFTAVIQNFLNDEIDQTQAAVLLSEQFTLTQ